MRLEQGSICDYCLKVMPPHEKITIKYERTIADKSTKCVVSAKSCSYTAIDLCPECWVNARRRLERPIKTSPRYPSAIFKKKCNEKLKPNLKWAE